MPSLAVPEYNVAEIVAHNMLAKTWQPIFKWAY
ncbi:MAG: hypothetical protein ACJAYB_000762 [Psychromonas sp.]|jgi:hypothetical protein